VKTISHGERVVLADHVAPGKITLFDYSAEWCGPCHALWPKIERLLAKRGDLAARKIDIVNWESEVAKQATADFKMPSIPYVRVYAADGRHVGDVIGNDIDAIEALVQQAAP